MNIAIILAGGTGSRMGADKPKQFLDLDGRTVIERSIDAFEQAPSIDEVAVVVHPDWMNTMRQIIASNKFTVDEANEVDEASKLQNFKTSKLPWKKVQKLIEGGHERYLSSLNAITAYLDYPDDTNLILHDAARPWVSQDIIARVSESLQYNEAVGVGIPSTDTIWETRQLFDKRLSKIVARIPERITMWRAQTPQAFRLPLIRDAYQRALQDSQFRATDDCGVVRRYYPETNIVIVEGEEQNRKITFKEDLSQYTIHNTQFS